MQFFYWNAEIYRKCTKIHCKSLKAYISKRHFFPLFRIFPSYLWTNLKNEYTVGKLRKFATFCSTHIFYFFLCSGVVGQNTKKNTKIKKNFEMSKSQKLWKKLKNPLLQKFCNGLNIIHTNFHTNPSIGNFKK